MISIFFFNKSGLLVQGAFTGATNAAPRVICDRQRGNVCDAISEFTLA